MNESWCYTKRSNGNLENGQNFLVSYAKIFFWLNNLFELIPIVKMSRHHRLNLKVNVKNKSTPARTRKAPFTRAFYGAFLACNEQIFFANFFRNVFGSLFDFKKRSTKREYKSTKKLGSFVKAKQFLCFTKTH